MKDTILQREKISFKLKSFKGNEKIEETPIKDFHKTLRFIIMIYAFMLFEILMYGRVDSADNILPRQCGR